MRHWNSLFGADILDFDYDVFVREPRPAVEKLLAFCGLDWEDDCMAFHRVRNAVKTASVVAGARSRSISARPAGRATTRVTSIRCALELGDYICN